VTSATYKRSSKTPPEGAALDPQNRLLARGARLRVDAEVVRDIALAASGLLVGRVGGPSVYPPLPEFLTQPPASYGPKVWREEKGEDRHRRALYTFRYRSIPYPMLQVFDAPNGDFACVRRTRSNTPLQALVTLNEPISMECARALGLAALKEGGPNDEARLAWAFRRCVARAPAAEESKLLLEFFTSQKERLAAGGAQARELAGQDDAVAAAWVATARVLLNLDETITKE
jgi:hypothetical protein